MQKVTEAGARPSLVFAAGCAHAAAPGATLCQGRASSSRRPRGDRALLGTDGDPTLGESTDRGTGCYRVPSLHGVGTRGPLLHDGTLPDVTAMFDPSRTSTAFTQRLHGSGPVAGHPFGLDLDASSRAALVAFLNAL